MSTCVDYMPGPDSNGNRCARCGTLPQAHADPPGCAEWLPMPGGKCACDRAGCQHPREVVKVREALERARVGVS